jgi:hypothetical protein
MALFDWMNQEVPISDTDWRLRSTPLHTVEEEGDEKLTAAKQMSSHLMSKMVPRPEKKLFQLAMAGLDRGSGQDRLHGYPWKDVGTGTVVDVGGGIGKFDSFHTRMRRVWIDTRKIGSFCMQLHSTYPDLNLIVQDREPVVKQAREAWENRHPSAVMQGKVNIVAHDFFQKNPVVGAEVYWLRHIM